MQILDLHRHFVVTDVNDSTMSSINFQCLKQNQNGEFCLHQIMCNACGSV
jgi:hypothetical protein